MPGDDYAALSPSVYLEISDLIEPGEFTAVGLLVEGDLTVSGVAVTLRPVTATSSWSKRNVFVSVCAKG